MSQDKELMRLSKLMSERGLASRREADALIEKGWVRVNGEVAKLGMKVSADAKVELSPTAAKSLGAQKTFLLHKPVGYVSAQPEKGYPAAASLIVPERRWANDPVKEPFPRRGHSWTGGLAPAGRLDIDSEGLLILTQNGRLVKQIIGPDSRLEKEYLVRFSGSMTAERKKLLQHGLKLEGAPLRPAQVELIDKDFVKIILTEGKKRQVRRMLELVDLKVLTLKRVRIGKIVLGDLPRGKWQHLPAHLTP